MLLFCSGQMSYMSKTKPVPSIISPLNEPLLGRSLQIHIELDPRRLQLMPTRTIRAPRRSTLLHPHHENREQNDQQRDHDRQQRPQNQMIHQLLRLVLMLERDIITIYHITVASERIAGLIPRTGGQSALGLIYPRLAMLPHISSPVTAAFVVSCIQHLAG